MIRIFLDRLYLFSGYLAGLFLIAIFVLMMLLSAGRPLGLNIPAGDDFISWCMAATAFLGLAHTFKHGEMIRVGLLIDRLGGKVQEEALKAGYGPTIRADAVKKLVDSVVNFQERSLEIIGEMRTLATRNSAEIRDAVEEGKKRMARLAAEGNALLANG